MKEVLKSIALLILLAIELSVFVIMAWAISNTHSVSAPFPTGWRLPFYNDGRARITNGPGEGQHTGDSAEAIDFVSFPPDTWDSTRYVRSTASGTVKIAGWWECPGWVVGIEHSSLNASLYEHLADGSIAVGPGMPVSRGWVLAVYDFSGRYPDCIDGAHLHFEAKNNVNWNDPFNSGIAVKVSDLRGIGWYPWWPNSLRDSGYVVQSTSHNFDTCKTDRTIDVRWPPYSVVNGGNYIDGYSWAWSTSSTTIPDQIKEAEETVSSTTSPSLAAGNWWFHLRVRSTEGEWASSSEIAHLGPFCLQ